MWISYVMPDNIETWNESIKSIIWLDDPQKMNRQLQYFDY